MAVTLPPEGNALVGVAAEEFGAGAVSQAHRLVVRWVEVVLWTCADATQPARLNEAQSAWPARIGQTWVHLCLLERALPVWMVHLQYPASMINKFIL